MKVLTAEQMREVDRLTTERYGIPSLQLMENAGAGVADYLERNFSDLADAQHRGSLRQGKQRRRRHGRGAPFARSGRCAARFPICRSGVDSRRRGDEFAALAAEGGGELRVVTSAEALGRRPRRSGFGRPRRGRAAGHGSEGARGRTAGVGDRGCQRLAREEDGAGSRSFAGAS